MKILEDERQKAENKNLKGNPTSEMNDSYFS